MASTSGANAQQLAVTYHAEHDVAQVPRRPAHLGLLHLTFGNGQAGFRGQQILDHLHDAGRRGSDAEQPPGGLGGDHHRVRTRLPQQVLVSASRMDATILALGAISRAVNVTSTAVSSRLVATMIEDAC